MGRPNVGKSTLVNALVGEKVAIVSDKPQTTRGAIRGIVDRDDVQIVLVDTPGYHKPRTTLGKHLNDVVRRAWSDVDLALFVLDGRAGVGRGDEKVARDLARAERHTICVVNKTDAMTPDDVLVALDAASKLGDFDEFVPASARTGDGIDVIADLIAARLPEGPAYYPPGMRTDQPPPVFVAELVREKLLARTRDEIPHSIAVVVDDLAEREDGLVEIACRIYVERDSQKGIVIGKKGALLKEVGTQAREEIEVLFGSKVFLDLRVKVEPDWQRHKQSLERLGFVE